LEHTYPELLLRVTPPRAHKMLLPRHRLSAFAQDIRDRSLIVLQAPSGYGKTSLLVQWRKDWMSNGELVAWLSVDERDDKACFLQGLTVAMHVAAGKTRIESSDAQLLSGGTDDVDVLKNWLANIAETGRDTVLIIDDFHHFSERIDYSLIKYLIQKAPANLRIVISSREVIEIDIHRLVRFDQCCFLSIKDLRFLRDETMSLLAIWSNARMEVSEAAYLHELTEGWPLGLQLLLSSIDKNTNLKDAVNRLSNNNGSIERYFIDFLMDRLPAEVYDFLICISCLNVVCLPLCVALMQSDEAASHLNILCKKTPIFIELKEPWLRMHPLVKKFLHNRWMLEPEDRRSQIHKNAAAWLAARSMHEEAAYHALQANQNKQAYLFIEQCLYEIAARGQFCRVLNWLDRLPQGASFRRPRLWMPAAWALAMGNRHDEAQALVAHILSHADVTPKLRAECDAILAFAAYYADRMDDFSMHIKPLVDKSVDTHAKIRALIVGQKALVHLYQGSPEAARYCLSTIGAGNTSYSFDAVKGFSVWIAAMSYIWEGQIKIAEKFLSENLLLAESELGRHSNIVISLTCALSAVLLELDRIDEARMIFSFSFEFLEINCPPGVIAQAYVTSAMSNSVQHFPD